MNKFLLKKANKLADRLFSEDHNSNPSVAVHPSQNDNGQWMMAVDYFADDGEGGYMKDRKIVGWMS